LDFFQILNGLAARKDAPAALTIPLGVVPGGSGNALAVSCYFDARSSVQFDYALDAAFAIARPILKPLKLIHIHSKKQDFMSFMGLGWGILADIDIESEKFRRLLGGSRFFASGVVRFANLRAYSGRLGFKLAPNAGDYSSRRKLSASKMYSESCPNFRCDKNNNNENGTAIHHNAELEHEVAQEAEYFDANFRNKMGVIDDEVDLTHHLKINDSNANFYRKKKIVQSISNSKLSAHLSQFDKLKMPALDQPVPDDWTQIEGDFYSVYLIYLNHLGSSCPFMSDSRLDDDLMYLTVIRTQSAGRLDLLRFLTNMSNGSHLDVPGVEVK
uniref:DAGKc domain-containing protein n=1 Tax=Romanomermis culicivorax TaxID=13658 RepID=A0A915KUD0_ROMCU